MNNLESLCAMIDTGGLLFLVAQLCDLMQGDCSDAPRPQWEVRGVPLVPLTQAQCLLVTGATIFRLGAGRLWMHNLYLRHTLTQVSDPVVWLVRWSYRLTQVEAHLWMTSCTLQGHGQYETGFGACGLFISSKAYVEGRHLPTHIRPAPSA